MSMMDSLIDEVMKPFPPMRTIEGVFGGFPTDVKELEDSYELKMNVPGFKKEDIDISVKNGTLVIKSEKETKSEEKNDKFILKERSSSSFSRSFKLPEDIDTTSISAKMEDGVLKLSIPKIEKQEELNKINIE